MSQDPRKYSEFITLGAITYGDALNAKYNNANYNKLSVPSQNCVYVSIPSLNRGGRNGEERLHFHISEHQTDLQHIHYVIWDS